MVDTIQIQLWGEELGALSWDQLRNFGSFEFYPSFLKKQWDVSPLHMPIARSVHKIYSFPTLNEATYKGLPGMLSDVLPDDFGNRLIDEWLTLNNIPRAHFTPIDRLVYIGSRGMGALEFKSNKKYTPEKQESNALAIDKLIELAKKVITKRQQLKLTIDDTRHLNELIKVGSSAGGQRAKAIIAFHPENHEIRSSQAKVPEGFKHYLFKFDGVSNEALGDPQGYGRIEYAYYKMAIDCGIEMMPSLLFEENGRAHFMTERFDRIGANEKVHMQTLCSLAHFDYRAAGMHSYENVFGVMRQLRLPHNDAIQLYKRMVFNIIGRNQDDHTKNISFLMGRDGIWRLSPAYDLTYAYNPQGIWTSQHQLSLNGKRDHFTRQDLIKTGEGIRYKNYKKTIDQTKEVFANWTQYAAEAGINKQQAKAIHKTFRLDL